MAPVARTNRPVRLPYRDDSHSKPALKRPNANRGTRARPRDLSCAPLAWGGFSRTAQSAGFRVSETKHEMTVDAAMVIANCLKNSPEMPEMNAVGPNTAHSVSA